KASSIARSNRAAPSAFVLVMAPCTARMTLPSGSGRAVGSCVAARTAGPAQEKTSSIRLKHRNFLRAVAKVIATPLLTCCPAVQTSYWHLLAYAFCRPPSNERCARRASALYSGQQQLGGIAGALIREHARCRHRLGQGR